MALSMGKLMALQIAAFAVLSTAATQAATAKSKSHKRTASGTQQYIAERLEKNEQYYETRYSSYSGQAPPPRPGGYYSFSGAAPREGLSRSGSVRSI